MDKVGAFSSMPQHPKYPVAAPEAVLSPQNPNFILHSRGGDETWQGQAQVLGSLRLCETSGGLSRGCDRAGSSPWPWIFISLHWCMRGDEQGAGGCPSELSGHPSLSISLCFPLHPHLEPFGKQASCRRRPRGEPGTIYLFIYFHTRGKHNNFKGAMASQRRSQEGPAARSWRAVSLTLIRSDTRVSPQPPHCVPQMYINISMHWHNMDPLFQALLRTRCCAGAAAAFEASERQ